MIVSEQTVLGECFHLQNGALSVWVAPVRGMNMERICFDGMDVIDCDETRARQKATYAVPILYPTPNRVEENRFIFDGAQVPAEMHGSARNREFKVEKQENSEEECSITGRIDYTKAEDKFPYESSLQVTVRLMRDHIRWEYKVQNSDERRLGYGIALHPFFKIRQQTEYQVFADKVMEMTQEKLPTGKLLDLTEKNRVNQKIPVQKYVLDDVFCAEQKPMAQIFYLDDKFKIELHTSEEFKRCVVFTPAQKDWFCLEPQTSSTNCHNLYSKGFEEEANLQIVLPGEEKTGWVEFVFSELE